MSKLQEQIDRELARLELTDKFLIEIYQTKKDRTVLVCTDCDQDREPPRISKDDGPIECPNCGQLNEFEEMTLAEFEKRQKEGA